MKKYKKFIFKDWVFDSKTKKLVLRYSYDDILNFTETFTFGFDFPHNYDKQLVVQACQTLFIMAGVSYYKAYLAEEIVIQKGQLDSSSADFFSETYQRGLGEFFYVNQLNPNTKITFPSKEPAVKPVSTPSQDGLLIGIGGGKDSLVTTEILRDQNRVATWSLGHRTQLEPLIKKIGLQHFWVERQIDQLLFELNEEDALNGHIPISAILACVGMVVAALTNFSDTIVSNESSTSEPNLVYQNTDINHQYSKSLEFEDAFQKYLKAVLPGMHYYSFLRPFTEVRISELFAQIGLDKYASAFSSCNRAFTQASSLMSWCGECPKCAFTFLALTPFVERYKLEELWGGKNLLLDPALEKTYKNLLGIEGNKPLDCVGEVKEARTAMVHAQRQYPELRKYVFDIPADYDYRKLSPHLMPDEKYQLLLTGTAGR